METQTTELLEATEGLYYTFSSYGLRSQIVGCPCCVDPVKERLFHEHALRQLNGSDLSGYAFDALTTWGDEYDFRHFLPRLFELACDDTLSNGFYCDIEIPFGKLRYADWQTWPEDERHAIDRYMRAFWDANLVGETDSYGIEDGLCALGSATDDIEPFLQMWLEPLEENRLRPLSMWLQSGQALGNTFWEPVPRLKLHAWLRSETMRATLEQAFFATEDKDLQAQISSTLSDLAYWSEIDSRIESLKQ